MTELPRCGHSVDILDDFDALRRERDTPPDLFGPRCATQAPRLLNLRLVCGKIASAIK